MLYLLDMSFGSRLRAARKAAKKRQWQVADEFGVTSQAVSQWERDETQPEPDKLTALADFLSTTVDDLLRDGGPKPISEVMAAPPPNLGVGGAAVPVRGSAAGAEGADLVIRDDVVEFVARPAGIARLTQAGVHPIQSEEEHRIR